MLLIKCMEGPREYAALIPIVVEAHLAFEANEARSNDGYLKVPHRQPIGSCSALISGSVLLKTVMHVMRTCVILQVAECVVQWPSAAAVHWADLKSRSTRTFWRGVCRRYLSLLSGDSEQGLPPSSQAVSFIPCPQR